MVDKTAKSLRLLDTYLFTINMKIGQWGGVITEETPLGRVASRTSLGGHTCAENSKARIGEKRPGGRYTGK